MYAIVKSGGHQYRVAEGQTLEVHLLEAAEGEQIKLDVLMIGGDDPKVGLPLVDGASVSATVLGEVKGRKILVQRYKRKKRYKRVRGHRQRYTRLQIDQIQIGN